MRPFAPLSLDGVLSQPVWGLLSLKLSAQWQPAAPAPVKPGPLGVPPSPPRVFGVTAPRGDGAQLAEGEYQYWLATGSLQGRSALVDVGLAAVFEGHEVRIEAETDDALYVEVFRSPRGGGSPQMQFRVKAQPRMVIRDFGELPDPRLEVLFLAPG